MLDKNALAQLQQLKTELRKDNPRFTGVVKGSSGRHGFITASDPVKQVHIGQEAMLKVFPGDTVEFTIIQDEQGRETANLEKLVTSELKTFTGELILRNNNYFIVADVPYLSRWIFVLPSQLKGAKAGDYVNAEIVRHPFKTGKPQANVVSVIGSRDQAGIEHLYTLNKFKLLTEWDSTQVADAVALAQTRMATELETRQDLTTLPFITIDGSDSTDLDDALYAEAGPSGWKLWVAIADPSAMVLPGEPLDLAARHRGNSIYLPGQTLHMLPPVLSEDYCSLLPGQRRLALVIRLDIDAQGQYEDIHFTQAVISSTAKLSYDEVSAALDNADGGYPWLATAQTLNQLRQVLTDYRKREQLVMEDRPDYRFVLDDQQHIAQIVRIDRSLSQRIVEECMLVANRACAQWLISNTEKAVFTCHAGIRPERIDYVKSLIANHLPDKVGTDVTQLEAYVDLIRYVQYGDFEEPLYRILSKQLDRGQLSLTPKAHHGLGLTAYATITSPIRKYQDLTLHRIIKATIANEPPIQITQVELDAIQSANLTGRQASRLVESWLKCIFAQTLGTAPLAGQISHINSRALSVVLDDNGVEGLVEAKHLSGKTTFDSNLLRLNSETAVYRLGQTVHVVFDKVDLGTRQIFFKLA